MDAVKFLVECHNYCEDCRAKAGRKFSGEKCFMCNLNYHINNFKQEGAEEMVRLVEMLVEKKKSKTRQSEFLKMFPNARLIDGVLTICPRKINHSIKCNDVSCTKCLKNYRLTPIEDTADKEAD